MEPDKFETHIKNKLEERRITPSDAAWERISGQLEEPRKQGKNGYFWMAIAASIVLILGTSLFFFTKSEEIEGPATTNVVDSENVKIIEQNKEAKDSIVLGDLQPEALVVNDTKESKVNRNGNFQPSLNPQLESVIDSGTSLAKTSHPSLEDEIIPMVPTEILDAKIADVIAQVNDIETYGKITEAEVDSLLMNAQKEILRERLFNHDNSVNAMALLTEVEEELDQSFRDQIFETLKAGFMKVRTAVADRNN
ncbi:hypothetical protein DZC72_16020 [Maribacter algicola]|uniref:Uncharacterized protein n=1 Tax=Maribacter algicola TaxID=2498892 RepID=A0A3R8QXY7_9FLAO|nr:hypothetical protein [Maribacter algicola]RRQ47862.1 hypothetical protein DZC72_16020 [Maribacter algicola]